MISVFKKQEPIQSGGSGDGSEDNPFSWGSIASGTTVTDLSAISSDSARYVLVNLTEGVEYFFYGHSSDGDSFLVVRDPINGEVGSSDSWDDDDVYKVGLHFTPDYTGDYIVIYTDYYNWNDGSDYYCEYSTATIEPAPNNTEAPVSGVTYRTSSGFNAIGRPMKFRSAQEAGCGHTAVPRDGLVFHVSLREQSDVAET